MTSSLMYDITSPPITGDRDVVPKRTSEGVYMYTYLHSCVPMHMWLSLGNAQFVQRLYVCSLLYNERCVSCFELVVYQTKPLVIIL